MRKLLAVAILVFSLPIVSLARPKISVPETHWDFGIVPQNATVSHDYWVKNIGNDTLRILDVRPG
jgi:hypothetical protein